MHFAISQQTSLFSSEICFIGFYKNTPDLCFLAEKEAPGWRSHFSCSEHMGCLAAKCSAVSETQQGESQWEREK